MTETSNSFYLDLEQGLYFLRMHFEMCEGSSDPELLDWGRFYLEWSRKASVECGPWSRENLELSEKIFQTLQKSKNGLMGFEALKKAMAEAAHHLNGEIKAALSTTKIRVPKASTALAGKPQGPQFP